MYGKVGGTASKPNIITTQVFRDPTAWYHIVVAVDVSQSTASNRVKIYVNGEQITSFTSTDYPDQNTDQPLLDGANMLIGARYNGSIVDYTDGYTAEFHFIDGTALTPASFGETNNNNQFVPIEYVGSYGTNGFYLPFSSTELANSFTDSSSSSHTITANGDVTLSLIHI